MDSRQKSRTNILSFKLFWKALWFERIQSYYGELSLNCMEWLKDEEIFQKKFQWNVTKTEYFDMDLLLGESYMFRVIFWFIYLIFSSFKSLKASGKNK